VATGQEELADEDQKVRPNSIARFARRAAILLVGNGIGRDFTKLWSASAVSVAGDGIALTAAPLLAFSLTSNPRLIAGVTTALTLPYLLFSLPAGVITDRVNGRRAMATVDGFRAVLVTFFTLLVVVHKVNLPEVYGCFFVIGTCDAFYRNTAQTILPQVVDRQHLTVANSRMMSAEIVMSEFLGPMAGGVLFAAAAALPFGIDAGSFAFSSTMLTRLRTRDEVQKAEPSPDERGPRKAWRSTLGELPGDLGNGLRALWQRPLLRSLAIMAGLDNLVAYSILATLVLFARHNLHLSSAGYGLLLAASAVGGVIASRVGPAILQRLGGGKAIVLGLAAQAACYLAIAFTSQPVLTAALLAVAGGAMVQWNVVTVVYRQLMVPSEVLGRVTSVYRLIAWGALPVGSLLGGFIAGAFGTRWVFVAAAIVLAPVTVSLLFMVRRYDLTASLRGAQQAAGAAKATEDPSEELS
jgi:MFS family permease